MNLYCRAAGLSLALLLLASPALAVEDFADLAERLSPSVVNISTSQKQGNARNNDGAAPFDDFLREFFERGRPPNPRGTRSLGSGFLIDKSGLIVTNSHVVPGEANVEVKLADGETYEAEILGVDEKTDIALLKIDAGRDLPFVRFGNSDTIRVGEPVLAIGNPFGLGGTVTAGIVSAIDRDIGAGPYDDFIQTDAAINRGSSGGPLFNRAGEVIGVNTVIISPSGGSVGIGFAVPASTAAPVIAQLSRYGETRRGWLGVYIQPVTPEIAEGLGLDEPRGALVAQTTEDGPAEKAGIRPGDVIIAFGGKPVENHRDLPRMVADSPTGRPAVVRIIRNGRQINLTVTIGRLEDFDRERAGRDAPEGRGGDVEPSTSLAGLGMELSRIKPRHREAYGIESDVEGIVITDVDPRSVAARAGLRAGHVILQIGQNPVSEPGRLRAEAESAKAAGRKSLLLLVLNQSGSRFISLPLEEE